MVLFSVRKRVGKMKRFLSVDERAQQIMEEDFFLKYLMAKYLNTGNSEFLKQIYEYERQKKDTERISGILGMMLIETNTVVFGNYSMEFLQALRGHLQRKMNCLEINNTRLLLLFYKDVSENHKRLAKAVYDFAAGVCKADCYLVVSRELKNTSETFESYQEMKALLDRNKFYYADRKIFYAEDKEEIKNVGTDIAGVVERLRTDIYLKDIVNLKEDYRQFEDCVIEESNGSYLYTKFMYAEFVSRIYEEMNLLGSENMREIIEQIYRFDNLLSVKGLAEKVIQEFEIYCTGSGETFSDEIEWIKNYIGSHLGGDLSIENLANNIYLSSGYVSYIFKQETGMKLSTYIKEQRMENAKKLLRESNMKIAQIGEAVGFSQASYFCQSFKKHYGISPGRYRKQNQE